MTPLYIFKLHFVGSLAFLFGSVWNIVTHAEPNSIFYVYAFGSLCFLYAAYKNLRRHQLSSVEDIPQYSRVIFDDSGLPKEYRGQTIFKYNHLYIYYGIIPNMPGHCIVQDNYTKTFHIGYHVESFKELTDELKDQLERTYG